MKAILFVDDHEVLARLSCEILEMQGYKAVSAYNAQDALSKFDNQSFDLMVTDFRNPQSTFDALVRLLPPDRVLTPRLLRISREPPTLME